MRDFGFFRSIYATFDYVVTTFARKSSNLFGFLLTYSYLCRYYSFKNENYEEILAIFGIGTDGLADGC